MPPTLKALSRRSLRPVEIADLLQRHVGDGGNEWVCQQAFEELRRLKDQALLIVPAVTIRLLTHPGGVPYSEQIRVVIDSLRLSDHR